ncbi:phage antirepressor KilAC domain-containing protein [Salibacterium sp. K-3]
MNNLLTFEFEQQQVRTEVINGEPYFVAKDICEVFGDTNYRRSIHRIDDDEKGVSPVNTPGGTQTMTVVNESGLYSLLFNMQPQKKQHISEEDFNSRVAKLKSFKRWVTSEVLPSIRKHGAYMTPEKIEETLMNPDTIIQLATNLKDEQQKRQAAEQQLQLDEPYSTFGKAVSNSNASINVGAFAKMIYENHGLRIGRNKLFAWLREQGYLIKHGRERNNPKQKYIEQGLFDTSVTLISRTEGDVESVTTLVTGKGQINLTRKLLNEYTEVM